MKVVHLLTFIHVGGPAALLKDLLVEVKLQKPEIDIEVWIFSKIEETVFYKELEQKKYEENFIKKLSDNGIKVHFKTNASNSIISKLNFIKNSIKNSNPNILHCHSETMAMYLVIGSLLKKVKRFQTIHSSKILFPKLQIYFFKYFFNKYITVSSKVTGVLQEKGMSWEKISEIRNGIKLERFHCNRKIKELPKKLVAVGRLTEAKNYPLMLNSFNSLKLELESKNIIVPTLQIIGNGEDELALKELLGKLNLKKEVSFLGIKNNVEEYLRNADIYLMTSKWEGLPISLLEASASALPIIATNVGSNSEIIGEENGILVSSNNEKEFTEKLNLLFFDYKRRKWFSKKVLEKSQEFNITNCAEKIIKVYLEK